MRVLFSIFLVVFVFVTAPVLAGPGGKDCDKVRSSADVMKCLNANYEHAQDKLNAAFDALTLQHSGEQLNKLKSLQMKWLEYRDEECEIEIAHLESESLKRLESLRCLERLTNERIHALEKSTAKEEDDVSVTGEMAAQPRWMNVLASDNPNILWRYGQRLAVDLDCDEDEEHVMSGLQVDPAGGTVASVVSVSENPVTGRPSAIVVSLDDAQPDGEDGEISCGLLADIAAHEAELAEGAEEACLARVKISRKECADQVLRLEGDAYVLGP